MNGTNEDARKRKRRPRGTPIKVWVTDEERAALVGRADQAGMSQSAFLRAAGLNHPIRSVYDLKAVGEMVRVQGELGRIAGVLREWRAEPHSLGAKPGDVEKTLKELWALQSELVSLAGKALRK